MYPFDDVIIILRLRYKLYTTWPVYKVEAYSQGLKEPSMEVRSAAVYDRTRSLYWL